MGKGSKPTIGFWYKVAYHHGITAGPIDAFLEFRGGDKIAWQGELTESGTIQINASNLWGGEKDQGGIEGPLAVMFGEPSQTPHPYLVSTFGPKTASWRGFTTVAFLGGFYGAMNPYPKPPSYKFRQILNGWDDECWYPEAARIALTTGKVFTNDLAFAATSASLDGSYAGIVLNVNASDTIIIEKPPGLTYPAYSVWPSDSTPEADGLPWLNAFRVTDDTTTRSYWAGEYYATAAAAEAAVTKRRVVLSGSSSYKIWIYDTPVDDNRGGLSLRIWKGGLIGINPAHVLYYSRTNSEMGREQASSINEASLKAAADKLYDEGFGICPKWDPASESVEDFEKRICKLIGGSFTRSLEDGQWYLDLARGDYNIDDLPILTDDDILDFKEQPSIQDNAINSVSVRYFDPERKETIVTPPVRAMGLVAAYGTIHQMNDYPEIPSAELATRVAQRDVLVGATPTRAFDLVTTRRTYSWRPNTYFRLQSPKRGIADMVCVVGDRQAGTLKSGAIKMKVAQDNSRFPDASFVQVEPGVDTQPSQTPTAITLQRAIEAPYVEVVSMLSRADLAALPPDVGYAMAVAASAASDIDYTMMVAPEGGDYAEAGRGQWCPTATVLEAAAQGDKSFTLQGGMALDGVDIGMAALWDDEIVRVDVLDVDAGTITLGRGCADTVPSPHAAGSRLWLYSADFAYDTAEYAAGETIDVKLLSNTGSQQQPLDSASAIPVVFGQRQACPYPPGKLLINGHAYPGSIDGDVTIVWSHRDRVLQADQLVDTTQGDIGPEPGVTTTLRIYDEEDALAREITGLTGSSYYYDQDTEAEDSGGLGGDLYFDQVTALLHGDGADGSTTILDETGKTWTRFGNAKISAAQVMFGTGSLYFDGTGDYLRVPATSDLQLTAGDFTVEAWIYPTVDKSVANIFSSRPSAAPDAGMNVFRSTGGYLNVGAWNGAAVFSLGSSDPSIPLNTWSHVRCTKAGPTWRLFVGGQLVGSANQSGAAGSERENFHIGHDPSGLATARDWIGYLDEIRITKGVARSTDDFVVPSRPFVLAAPTVRPNGRLRIELESVRDGLTSYQHHDVTILRHGYGFNYGKFYGGKSA